VDAQWQHCFLESADASLPQANQKKITFAPYGISSPRLQDSVMG
jgi:hypothetical protein